MTLFAGFFFVQTQPGLKQKLKSLVKVKLKPNRRGIFSLILSHFDYKREHLFVNQ